MALTKPKEGSEYVLTNAEGIGAGIGSVPTGTHVVVEEIHKEPRAGVAGDVVVSFAGPTVEVGGEKVTARRRLSLALADFKRMFNEIAGEDA